MQLQTKASLIVGGASVCLLVAAFSKVLSIPGPWRFIPLILGLVLLLIGFQVQKEVVRQRQALTKFQKAPAIGETQRKKVLLVIGTVMVIGSIIFLFLMPYIIEDFWPGMYLIIVPLQIIFVFIALRYIRKKFFAPYVRRR